MEDLECQDNKKATADQNRNEDSSEPVAESAKKAKKDKKHKKKDKKEKKKKDKHKKKEAA